MIGVAKAESLRLEENESMHACSFIEIPALNTQEHIERNMTETTEKKSTI